MYAGSHLFSWCPVCCRFFQYSWNYQLVRVCVLVRGGIGVKSNIQSLRGHQSTLCSLGMSFGRSIDQIHPQPPPPLSLSLSPRLVLSLDIHMLDYVT